MISIHEMTAGSGVLRSYSWALLSGAVMSAIAAVLAFGLRPSRRESVVTP
jgi:hypothetical protein